MKITHFCPAKVNLFLEVTGKLPNGYHELKTLFAKINIGDTLTIDITPSPQTHISLTLTGPVGAQLPANPNNLVWKAAQAFLDFFELTATLHITLDKHTPTGAGLGGGSSDAAHVLLILCEFFKKDFKLLLPLAAKLGADVPLFMFQDTFLKGEGIGEKLTPVSPTENLPYLVLAYPNKIVPTKGVFGRLQLPSPTEVLTNCSKLDKLIDVISTGQPFNQWKGLLFNRLEGCVLPHTPEVRETWQAFVKAKAEIVLMSGSGSTVFCLAKTKTQAERIFCLLQDQKKRVCYMTTFYEDEHRANNRNTNTSNE